MKTCSFCGARPAEFHAWPGAVVCRPDAVRIAHKLPWLKLRPINQQEQKNLMARIMHNINAQAEYRPYVAAPAKTGVLAFFRALWQWLRKKVR